MKKPESQATPADRRGTTVIADGVYINIPGWVADIDSFRRWTDAEDFPERGNVWWLCGGVWADMSKEQVFTHTCLKGDVFAVLANLVKADRPGLVFIGGPFFSNPAADIAGKPDGLFLSNATLASDRARFIEEPGGGVTELQGSPDMVLEVVSDSSEEKDLVTLPDAYWKAGVTEYWVVDARNDAVKFDIFRHTPKEFKRTPKKHGWMASGVFGKAFRLTAGKDEAGHPEFTLEVR